jgi:ATP-dependent Lhr-like helicase
LLLAAEGFDADLEAALAGGVMLRERFRRVALTGLMLLRNPPGGRRRVGGRDWAERRLFDQVRATDPDFILLRQALREVRDEECDAGMALAFLDKLPRSVLSCRWLAQPSPFAEAWTQLSAGPVETVQDPTEALRRLHAELTGGGR